MKKQGLALAMSVALLCVAANTESLLQNADFEQGINPELKDCPAFWWEWHEGNAGGSVITYKTPSKEYGSCGAVRFIKNSGAGCFVQAISFVENDVIKASAMVKTSPIFKNAGALLKIEFKDKDGNVVKGFESPRIESATATWKKVEVTAEPVPEDVAQVCICLFILGSEGAEGKAYFDNIRAIKVAK